MTANEKIRDALILHELAVRRVGGGLARSFVATLRQAEDLIAAVILARLGWIARRGYRSSAFTTQSLKTNLREVLTPLAAAYGMAGKGLRTGLTDLAIYESAFLSKLLGDALAGLPGAPALTELDNADLRSLVAEAPLAGALVSDWIRQMRIDAATRVTNALRTGLHQENTIEQLLKATDEALAVGYRKADGAVRDIANAAVNETRYAIYAENVKAVPAVQWTCVLDAATCMWCAAHDGFLYHAGTHESLEGGPHWGSGPGNMHPRCRCEGIPALGSWRQLDADHGEMDAELRIEYNGIPAEMQRFPDWLKRQSAGIQDEVLGKAKGKLFRAGKLKFGDLLAGDGHILTLDELKAREAA